MIRNITTVPRRPLQPIKDYARVPRKIGPYSGQFSLVKVDGRTKEAALIRDVRDELTRYVGGKPNVVERALIERCCWLSLRIALLDRKLASGHDFTQIDSNVYLAWVGSLRRTISCLQPTKNGKTNALPLQQRLASLMAEAEEQA
jgi:hypothetical protein